MHVYGYPTPIPTGAPPTAGALVGRTSWTELNDNITIAQKVNIYDGFQGQFMSLYLISA